MGMPLLPGVGAQFERPIEVIAYNFFRATIE